MFNMVSVAPVSPKLFLTVLLASLVCSTSGASQLVLEEDYETYALGPFGTVSDFSDATYGGANAAASIVAGQGLEFSFDVKTNVGALNTNVASQFPTPAVNNSSPDIANYVLEFDLAILSGINTGWFGVVEVASPGSGPRTLGLNMGALTPGGPAVHHSMSLADMSQPYGTIIDPTDPNWTVRLVALGFPANGGGGTVRTTVLLDNVRVTSLIPEPGSLVLATFTLAMVCISTRRR